MRASSAREPAHGSGPPIPRSPLAGHGAKSFTISRARARQPGAREPDPDAHEPGAHDSRDIALPSQSRPRPRSHHRTQPPRYREARRLGRADPAVSIALDGLATLSLVSSRL